MAIMEDDLFGLERERKIKKSGVREVFTPHKPIQSVELFFGRQSEIAKLIQNLNTPGQHALLYGDRGVGKSSLARVASELLLRKIITGTLYIKRCDSCDNFSTILEDPLRDVGVDISINEKSSASKKSISSNFLNISPNFSKDSSSKSDGYNKTSLSPSWVAKKIENLKGLLLIDEFDVLRSDDDKKKISELIKQLSDSGSPFKVLVVGIAETATDLTMGHLSVQRCLKEAKIYRMQDDALRSIIEGGQERLGIKFANDAINRIVKVSSGYPHFTHLLALKSAEDAIADERVNIKLKDVINATQKAVEDAEGSLRNAYNEAVRSTNTDEYKKILLAAALCNEEEFKAKELRAKYEQVFKKRITQGALNNHFQRLVSEDNSCILKRIAKGVYKFNDPRMPSFIKIAQSFLQE